MNNEFIAMEWQKEVVESQLPTIFVGGGLGAGKSVACLMKIKNDLGQHRGAGMIVSPSRKYDHIIPLMCKIMPDNGISHVNAPLPRFKPEGLPHIYFAGANDNSLIGTIRMLEIKSLWLRNFSEDQVDLLGQIFELQSWSDDMRIVIEVQAHAQWYYQDNVAPNHQLWVSPPPEYRHEYIPDFYWDNVSDIQKKWQRDYYENA